jgi:predicted phosphodiesterase
MRVALLSDIHGNSLALEAVLADIERHGGADAFWILGDLVALGHDPVGVLERLSDLPNVRCTRGNTERYVCTGDRPPPTADDVKADPHLLPVLVEVAGTFAWTQGAITQAGWLEWLANLPVELRQVLPDGTRFLGVHAAPGTDGDPGIGIHPGLEEADLCALLRGCEADLICVGHTHWPMDVQVDGRRIVNVGSVSNPLPPDLRASYVMLEALGSGHQVEHRRVDYDRDAVVAALRRTGHPGAGFIVKHMRGEVRAQYQRRVPCEGDRLSGRRGKQEVSD